MDVKLRRQFSDNLRRVLEENDKTQADLARYMKVSTATVSDWCNGKQLPRLEKIRIISAWLGISAADLIPKIGIFAEVSGMMVTDPDEQKVVVGYRNADDLEKAMVRRTLGIDKKGSVGQAKDSSAS